tara:strand:+ start:33 stop:446 length:414 start_codon:yes stop_codon:yes gene_type:complete
MFEYVTVEDGMELRSLDAFRPFKCIVLISQEVSEEWQHKISTWLVASGCLYMMAWGHKCETWDDSVDFAHLEQSGWDVASDDQFVITTWHSDESLEDVFFFAKCIAQHPTVELEKLVVLDIGAADRREFLQTIFDRV